MGIHFARFRSVLMAFDLDPPTISLLTFGAAFAALQVWWIGALLVRNHRHRGERPLSSQQFRRDLERIFRQES